MPGFDITPFNPKAAMISQRDKELSFGALVPFLDFDVVIFLCVDIDQLPDGFGFQVVAKDAVDEISQFVFERVFHIIDICIAVILL